MQLTRTLVPAKVVASIRITWVNAALLAAYENCPLLEPFITPEMLDTQTIDEV